MMTDGRLPDEGLYGDRGVPPVRFDVSPRVMADLERLAWSNTNNETFLLADREQHDKLPPILDSVHMAVDGTADPFGNFSFDSRLALSKDYVLGAAQALQAFVNHTGGVVADSGESYFLLTPDAPDDLWYSLRLESASTTDTIAIRTVGSLPHDNQTQPSPYQSPNHNTQSVGYTVEDFLDVNEQLISFLHQYFGIDVPDDEAIRLTCRKALIRRAPEQLTDNIERPGPRFADIGGYDTVKQRLMDMAMSFQHPELLAAYGVEERQSGILLYGEGGTGKTTLVEALANEIGAELRLVRATDIYGKWLGDSEKNMDTVFDKAEAAAGPYVLLFDELESIVGKGAYETSQRVVGLFKQRSARLAAATSQVILAATINDRSKVDDVVTRAGRFDVKQYVPLPDDTTRQQIFAHFVERHMFRARREVFAAFDIDYEQLAQCTDGLSGADIAAIMKAVALKQAMQELAEGHPPVPAGTAAITTAINLHKRNLS